MSGETETNVSGWTIDTLKVYFETSHNHLEKRVVEQIRDLVTKLDERYATQTKATDAAFVAQQTAMKTAFDAADKAVQAALAAAKEASNKAESAADKRFEATNEFREQLADQARTFLPRNEYETSYRAMTEKVDTGLAQRVDADTRNTERINNLELRLTSRLDTNAGGQAGALTAQDDDRWRVQNSHTVTAMLISGISILVALGTILAVVLTGHP